MCSLRRFCDTTAASSTAHSPAARTPGRALPPAPARHAHNSRLRVSLLRARHARRDTPARGGASLSTAVHPRKRPASTVSHVKLTSHIIALAHVTHRRLRAARRRLTPHHHLAAKIGTMSRPDTEPGTRLLLACCRVEQKRVLLYVPQCANARDFMARRMLGGGPLLICTRPRPDIRVRPVTLIPLYSDTPPRRCITSQILYVRPEVRHACLPRCAVHIMPRCLLSSGPPRVPVRHAVPLASCPTVC